MIKEIYDNPILWSPSEERIKNSEMYRFIKTIIKKLDSPASI